MSLAEWFVEILVGMLILYVSYQVGWKGNVRLLHGCHYLNVSSRNIQPFTRKMGIGGVIVGFGIVSMPIINWLTKWDLGYYMGLGAVVIGVIWMACTVIKYNGALISFRRK